MLPYFTRVIISHNRAKIKTFFKIFHPAQFVTFFTLCVVYNIIKVKNEGNRKYGVNMLNSVKNVEFSNENGMLIAFVKGEVDHHNASSARRAIDRELEKIRPAQLALDLSAVSFMDSSGLGLILGRYNKAVELGVKFTVRNPTSATMKIISLAGGERIFDVITDHIENENN